VNLLVVDLHLSLGRLILQLESCELKFICLLCNTRWA
jgi:hypothetical protein